ncbi:MAG TPA: hypothetical protein VFY41_09885 [Nitrososphaeraceae archaeon]|nr:hypothetical protein [Nitrososphaeraceae archaeon]
MSRGLVNVPFILLDEVGFYSVGQQEILVRESTEYNKLILK